MESKRLDSAAQAAGISLSYINAHGKPQSIGADTKRRLLDAMHKADAKASVAPVPNVKVFTAGKKMPLAVEGRGEFSWLLTTEEGHQHKGHATGGKAFNLPAKLPEGYHRLTLTQAQQRFHAVAMSSYGKPGIMRIFDHIWRFDTGLRSRLLRRWQR